MSRERQLAQSVERLHRLESVADATCQAERRFVVAEGLAVPLRDSKRICKAGHGGNLTCDVCHSQE